MDYSIVAPKTFVLKLNFQCQCQYQGCERKLKNLLQKIHGVHSTSIDTNSGKVTITGTAEPHKVIKVLKKHYRTVVFLMEEHSPQTDNHTNMQITVQPQPVVHQEFHDQDLVTQMHQFVGIKGLKHVEVTISKTTKLTFKRDESETSHDSPQMHRCGGGHGGGGCDVHNSCCSCGNRQPPACGCTLPEVAPPWSRDFPPPPEPPQPEYNYFPSAPPWAYGYPYTFEENPNRTLM